MRFPREYRLDRLNPVIEAPAATLPMNSQFLRPTATPRIEFSARLLLSSSSG